MAYDIDFRNTLKSGSSMGKLFLTMNAVLYLIWSTCDIPNFLGWLEIPNLSILFLTDNRLKVFLFAWGKTFLSSGSILRTCTIFSQLGNNFIFAVPKRKLPRGLDVV